MKPKRIKALKRYIAKNTDAYDPKFTDGTEPCYVLRQSDVRALAGQLARDFIDARLQWVPSMLYALKRAGITPGRARKGTK